MNVSIDLLLLVAPKELSVNTVFAIDQFLMGGGSVVIFLLLWTLPHKAITSQLFRIKAVLKTGCFIMALKLKMN